MITSTVSCTDHAFAAVEEHTAAQLDGEVGGFLLGVIEDGTVMVRVAVPAAEAVGGRAQVTFTHADWDQVHRLADTEHRDLRIVGWYHSHPGFGIFLSEYDRFIHANFFAEPEMVALVRDPHDGAHGWFGWKDGEIALLDGSEGVDGQSPVDTGAAPAALSSGSPGSSGSGGPGGTTSLDRSAGRLALGGVALLVVGFALGWGAGLWDRPAPVPAVDTTALEAALEQSQADLANAQQRVDRLLAGRDAVEPQPDRATVDEAATAAVTTYRVRPGDTLSTLADAFYGSPEAWRELARANDISDPDALDVGQRLQVPPLP